MEQNQGKIDLSYYVDMLWRRKWYVIPTFFLVSIAGLIYCLTTPQVYQASTTITVDRPKVPEAFVRSTVTAGLDERIQSIAEEITSRTNLERVMAQLDLYPEERKQLPMQLVVERMRQSIRIEPPKKATAAFTITYESTSPTLVAPVVDTLASMFMEEHLKLREERAKGTSEFLADELKQLEVQLRDREAVLSRYKGAHTGEIPTQSSAILTVLGHLQQQLEGVQESLRRAQESRILLQQQKQIAASVSPGEPGGDADNTSLEQLGERLMTLEARYTADHPDVLKTRSMIKKMEEKLAATPGDVQAGKTENETRSNPALRGLQKQLLALDIEIRNFEIEAAGLKKKISYYQTKIENMPRREQELADLQRDYDNLSANYQQLLGKKLEAERAENLEIRQKGEQFRILDPARPPQVPIKPDVPRTVAITFAAALAASVGLAFAREYLDKSFYRIEDIESFLKLPVLAGIPMLMTASDVEKQRKTKLVGLGAVSCGLLVVSTLLVAVMKKYPRFWV